MKGAHHDEERSPINFFHACDFHDDAAAVLIVITNTCAAFLRNFGFLPILKLSVLIVNLSSK
jgi:hypothetical protein